MSDQTPIAPEGVDQVDTPDVDTADTSSSATTEEVVEPKVFDEAYVKGLRDEAAKYRTKAKGADALAARLHTALVAAHGKLADPSDLPFDPAHLDDEAALAAAVDELLARKPHLAARRVSGDVGQGARNGAGTVDLLGMLRGH